MKDFRINPNPLTKKIKKQYPEGAAIRVYQDPDGIIDFDGATDRNDVFFRSLLDKVFMTSVMVPESGQWLSTGFEVITSAAAASQISVWLGTTRLCAAITSQEMGTSTAKPRYFIHKYSLIQNDFYLKVQKIIVKPLTPSGGVNIGGLDVSWRFVLPAFPKLRDPDQYSLISEYHHPGVIPV